MEKTDSRNIGQKSRFTRRNFLKFVGTVTGASAMVTSGTSLLIRDVFAGKKQFELEKPKFKITKLDTSAQEIYTCQKTLKRFNCKNMAFKKVSEEFGVSWLTPWFQNMKENIMKSQIGYGINVKSPSEARAHQAFAFGANTWNMLLAPYGEGHENMGLLSWNPLHVPPDLRGHPDSAPEPSDLTKKVKQMAMLYGADKVGVTRFNRKWIFEQTCRNMLDPNPPDTKQIVFRDIEQPTETDMELIIPDRIKYAIVFVVVMPRPSTQLGPSSFQTHAAANLGYGRMGLTAIALAEAIRTMGYTALPCMNDTGLSVPLAIDAGLGQLGRLGHMITPWFGPHVRIAKVLTDMPLLPDSPIDFGVTEYCTTCGICARQCPSNAISLDADRAYEPPATTGPTGNPGALKWYINGKRCLRWWIESGAACSKCIDVCPYTSVTLGDHYGKDKRPEKFWDLDVAHFGHRKVIY